MRLEHIYYALEARFNMHQNEHCKIGVATHNKADLLSRHQEDIHC
jgi:hypothetical protein